MPVFLLNFWIERTWSTPNNTDIFILYELVKMRKLSAPCQL